MSYPDSYKDVADAFFAYHGLIKHTLFAADTGLTKSQAMLMAVIKDLDTVNMSTLAQRIAVSKEQATRAVQPLVEAGYVQRNHNEANRRMIDISLTPAGNQLLEEHFATVENLIAQQLEALTPEEQDRLLEASRTAASLLHKAFGDKCGNNSPVSA